MSQLKIHYKDCTQEDVCCLEQFEPEIRKAVAVKGLAVDVCWRGYVLKDYRFFQLYVMTTPETFLGGDYGEAFLRKVSREEFLDWMIRTPNSKD